MEYVTVVWTTRENLNDETKQKILQILNWHGVRKIETKKTGYTKVKTEVRIYTKRKPGEKTLKKLLSETNAAAAWVKESNENNSWREG